MGKSSLRVRKSFPRTRRKVKKKGRKRTRERASRKHRRTRTRRTRKHRRTRTCRTRKHRRTRTRRRRFPLARSIPIRNSPNILDVYGMADGETDGLLSRMDCPERLQWCQTNRENRDNCNRDPVLSRYIRPCREKSTLNKSKQMTKLLINRFLTWKIAIKPDSFSEKPPGYIYLQNLRRRGIEMPMNVLEFTSSMDIPNDVQTMLFDFLTMEGYEEDHGEPNDTIRFLEQLRGAYEDGPASALPWDGRRPNDAANAVANADILIVDFVNGFRRLLLKNTEYSEQEIETFIHKFLSTINLGV